LTPSFADELRAVRENVLARAVKTVPVPGSHGTLAVRFRPPEDRDKLTPVVASYMVRGALSREQELQLLVDCCDEILMRDENGELVSADPDGGPLRFDGSDARWGLGENATARDTVAKLYNLDVQPLAITGTADAVVDWLQGVDAEAAASVEGKYESAADAPS
jgi:hypothetical protein